ncbi:hypothetical protein A3770_14p72390 [Chloropicon primus]|uniref:Uncharacterized protein n=2 Tax=Chloropicon primus TaxID=1764295 RepID=A0A5B8MWN9_9CHLO|nr:hypothetical protein A3770_14p72390 [Chloropicon primus]|eukprot:QDZ24721.1 hypothetical protein A3770_14p72390 [Chloropicon primus]
MASSSSRRGGGGSALVLAILLVAFAFFFSRTNLASSPARKSSSVTKRSLEESAVRYNGRGVGAHRRGKMSDYVRKRTAQCDEAGGWRSVDAAREGVLSTYLFGDRFVKPTKVLDPKEERYLSIRACEVVDDGEGREEGGTGWQIYRFGPFVGVGGTDWHQVWVRPLPVPRRAKFITGKVSAPVDETGRVLGHPPVYSHHVHIAYNGVNHCLESHGDTTCSEDLGGTSCYLRTYPEGHGLPFNASSGDHFALTFHLNDIREYPAPPMVFYQEIALKWSAGDREGRTRPVSCAVQHMHPGGGHPFATTLVTRRPSFLWSTTKWMVDGKVLVSQRDQQPWFHAHRKFCQAAWVFAASPEQLGLTTDLLRQVDDSEGEQRTGENDLVWTPEAEDPVQALVDRVLASEAGMESLRCWLMDSESERVLEHVRGTDSSPSHPEAWRQNWRDGWYDRAGELHCDREWSFRKGDNYTVVTLNGLDERIPPSDLETLTQHGALLLAYESMDEAVGEHGPSWEVFAPYSTDLHVMYVLASNWTPKTYRGVPYELLPPTTREEKFNRLFKEELGLPLVGQILAGHDQERLIYGTKKHEVYNQAVQAIQAEAA